MRNAKSDNDRRRRRRRRRVQVIVIYTAIAVGLAWFFESQATTTVIFVRHAEKMAGPTDDPSLSAAGQRRAAELARQLIVGSIVLVLAAIIGLRVWWFKRKLRSQVNASEGQDRKSPGGVIEGEYRVVADDREGE